MSDDREQDVFISHAHADKAQYVQPLTDALSAHDVTFWLDDAEIAWGDSVMGKINEGLRTSRFALVCLSNNFLRRPWPEAEMSGVLSIQNTDGVKRVLPLILNSKDVLLKQYPLVAGLAYREFDQGPDKLAAEIARLTKGGTRAADEILITVEGVHTGKLCRLRAPLRASVRWVTKMAQSGLNVEEALKVGPFSEFHVRWVLVDVAAEGEWLGMPRPRKREIHAMVLTDQGLRLAKSARDRLDELEVRDGTVFHMYAIEDEDFPTPAAPAPL
jgi:hypothetical protein